MLVLQDLTVFVLLGHSFFHLQSVLWMQTLLCLRQAATEVLGSDLVHSTPTFPDTSLLCYVGSAEH